MMIRCYQKAKEPQGDLTGSPLSLMFSIRLIKFLENPQKTGKEKRCLLFLHEWARDKIEYRTHLRDGKWRAYDVVIEGVGLVNNYRSQFSSILAKSSFDDLLKQVKEKNLRNK
jgi:hypothetical protein